MHRRPPRLSLILLLVLAAVAIGVTAPSRADAVCNVSACDAAALTSNPQCCTVSTCTVDGTLTVTGPTPCTFDFGSRNLTVSGQVAAQGKTITLKAKSMKLTGLIDVRGLSGANAGNVTIVTTGGTAVAYSQEGGTSAIIDASSGTGIGGNVTIQADGMVSFAKGSVTATGGASGGVVAIQTTAGDVSVQIAISASSSVTALAPAGEILVTAPGDLSMGGSGRFVADLGDIDIQVDGAASFAEGSLLQASGGGAIAVVAASMTAFGEFKADGDGGAVELQTITGPMFLQRLSQGITVGPGVQSVSLSTEGAGPAGLLTMDMPILASGGEVEIVSAGGILISKKIETTGILDSEAGDITIDAEDDVHITKAIVGTDVYGDSDLSIDGRDVIIEGNLDFRGGLDTSGGHIDITADRDLKVQGDIFFNVSGADASDAGSIDMQAGRDITVGPLVEFIADGSPEGTGGGISMVAGEGFGERLPGKLELQGDIKATGHTLGVGGSRLVVRGCDVTIPGGANLDVTGDAGSFIQVVARKSLSIGGTLKATSANILEFPAGVAPLLTGSLAPAPSAGPCINGTATANGCQRPLCTDKDIPANCIDACPACGDGQQDFPETCDIGPGNAFCSGIELCDVRCRHRTCLPPTPCTIAVCDPVNAVCTFQLKPDNATCDADDDVCTGVGKCASGTCHPTPGTALQCNDQNPCTGPDTCDRHAGCINPNRPNGPGVAGCDDLTFCTGVETCENGVCQSGSFPCTMAPNTACDPVLHCVPPAHCDPEPCPDDGNPCTDSQCNAHQCAQVPVPLPKSCDTDGNVCNGIRMCGAAGICQQPVPPAPCNDHNPCTTDTCDAVAGCQFSDPAPGCCTGNGQCNDANACTIDTCTPFNTCDHATITCVDNDACTVDACDPQTGCTHDRIPTCQGCDAKDTCPDDADACTDKECIAHRCEQVHNPNCCQTNEDCTDIDSNPCTSNGSCNGNRCGVPTPLPGASCGTACNPATCNAQAECVSGTSLSCSDNDMCTTDVCTDNGCTHTHIEECCIRVDDCNDRNACTDDVCDDANLCNHPVPDPLCEPCDVVDPFDCGPRCSYTCQEGRCVSAGPNCNDGDACTNDACDMALGCTHTRRTDGDCTTKPPPPPPTCIAADCVDDDPCTIDACTADNTACTHDQKIRYDSLYCRLDDMKAKLTDAPADHVTAKLRKRTAATLTKLRAKVDKASAAPKCNKKRSLLGKLRGPLRKLQRTLNRLSGRQIDADLATTLGNRAGETLGKVDEVRADPGC